MTIKNSSQSDMKFIKLNIPNPYATIESSISALQSEINKKNKQLSILKWLTQQTTPITEEEWIELIKPFTTDSKFHECLLKHIFPDAEYVRSQKDFITFRLYDFKCKIPTTGIPYVEVDTSWYTKYEPKDFDSWLETYNPRIYKYLTVNSPKYEDKLDYYFGPGIHTYEKLKKLLFYVFNYKKINKAISQDTVDKIYSFYKEEYNKTVQLWTDIAKKCHENTVILKEKLLPELHRFTQSVYSGKLYGGFMSFDSTYSVEEILKMENLL